MQNLSTTTEVNFPENSTKSGKAGGSTFPYGSEYPPTSPVALSPEATKLERWNGIITDCLSGCVPCSDKTDDVTYRNDSDEISVNLKIRDRYNNRYTDMIKRYLKLYNIKVTLSHHQDSLNFAINGLLDKPSISFLTESFEALLLSINQMSNTDLTRENASELVKKLLADGLEVTTPSVDQIQHHPELPNYQATSKTDLIFNEVRKCLNNCVSCDNGDPEIYFQSHSHSLSTSIEVDKLEGDRLKAVEALNYDDTAVLFRCKDPTKSEIKFLIGIDPSLPSSVEDVISRFEAIRKIINLLTNSHISDANTAVLGGKLQEIDSFFGSKFFLSSVLRDRDNSSSSSYIPLFKTSVKTTTIDPATAVSTKAVSVPLTMVAPSTTATYSSPEVQKWTETLVDCLNGCAVCTHRIQEVTGHQGKGNELVLNFKIKDFYNRQYLNEIRDYLEIYDIVTTSERGSSDVKFEVRGALSKPTKAHLTNALDALRMAINRLANTDLPRRNIDELMRRLEKSNFTFSPVKPRSLESTPVPPTWENDTRTDLYLNTFKHCLNDCVNCEPDGLESVTFETGVDSLRVLYRVSDYVTLTDDELKRMFNTTNIKHSVLGKEGEEQVLVFDFYFKRTQQPTVEQLVEYFEAIRKIINFSKYTGLDYENTIELGERLRKIKAYFKDDFYLIDAIQRNEGEYIPVEDRSDLVLQHNTGENADARMNGAGYRLMPTRRPKATRRPHRKHRKNHRTHQMTAFPIGINSTVSNESISSADIVENDKAAISSLIGAIIGGIGVIGLVSFAVGSAICLARKTGKCDNRDRESDQDEEVEVEMEIVSSSNGREEVRLKVVGKANHEHYGHLDSSDSEEELFETRGRKAIFSSSGQRNDRGGHFLSQNTSKPSRFSNNQYALLNEEEIAGKERRKEANRGSSNSNSSSSRSEDEGKDKGKGKGKGAIKPKRGSATFSGSGASKSYRKGDEQETAFINV